MDVKKKIRIHRLSYIIIGILLIVLISWGSNFNIGIICMFTIIIVLSIIVSMNAIRFCDSCGAKVYYRWTLSDNECRCPRCGNKLNVSKCPCGKPGTGGL